VYANLLNGDPLQALLGAQVMQYLWLLSRN